MEGFWDIHRNQNLLTRPPARHKLSFFSFFIFSFLFFFLPLLSFAPGPQNLIIPLGTKIRRLKDIKVLVIDSTVVTSMAVALNLSLYLNIVLAFSVSYLKCDSQLYILLMYGCSCHLLKSQWRDQHVMAKEATLLMAKVYLVSCRRIYHHLLINGQIFQYGSLYLLFLSLNVGTVPTESKGALRKFG